MASFAVNLKGIPDEVVKLLNLKGTEIRAEWTDGGLDITFDPIKDENIPDEDGWSLDSNGNETYGIPMSKGENGNLMVGGIELLEDTDDMYLGAKLLDGTVIKKIPRACKTVFVAGQFLNVWKEWKNSDKCRRVIEKGELRLTANLSRNGDKMQSVRAKENDPIVNMDYDEAIKLATELGDGEYELMHDAEYSIDWIYQIYVKKDDSINKNWYWLWVQTTKNNRSEGILVEGYHHVIYEVGSRSGNSYRTYYGDTTLRASLKGDTVH